MYYRLMATGLACLLLAGCGGNGSADRLPGDSDPLAGNTAGQAALREVQALQAPADVDTELFEMLRAELVRSLQVPQPEPRSAANLEDPIHPHFDQIPISIDHGIRYLSWEYRMAGDYDQNGEVNAADLTPLAKNFGAKPEEGSNRFYAWTPERVVDGNLDGEVNISDVTVIGRNFGRRFLHYEIYASDRLGDIPFNLGETPIPHVAEADLSEIYNAGTGKPLYFHRSVSPHEHSYYWVRLMSSTGPNAPTCYAANRDMFTGKENTVLPFRQPETNLSYDAQENSVTFRMVYAGDGNRDGRISLADNTSLGLFLGESDWPFIREYSSYSEYHDADFNRDGVVDVCDLVMVGFNFFDQIEGYRLYYAPASGVGKPSTHWHGQSQEAIAEFRYSSQTIRSEDSTYELPFTPESGSWLWLRPYNSEGYGAVCEFVQVQ